VTWNSSLSAKFLGHFSPKFHLPLLGSLASLQTLRASGGESWNALNPWFSSSWGFDVPLATALCKTFLLRMLNDG
jgi:hypothetical protein